MQLKLKKDKTQVIALGKLYELIFVVGVKMMKETPQS
jgi:hypothetical protein